MTSATRIAGTHDRRVVLSALWGFAMFNYLYADVFTVIFDSAAMQKMVTGMADGIVLAWAAFMEIAMAMVFLSRVLRQRVNRWANIAAGVLNTASVAWSLMGGAPRPYYAFFAAVEMACTVFIVWYAWTWKPQPLPAGGE